MKKIKVDSHLHVNYKGLDAKGIIKYMDREGIDLCWLLTWEEAAPPHPVYMHLSVDDAFEAYDRYPDRIVPMYAPDPGRPEAVERFLKWHAKGLRGCGELKVSLRWDSVELDPLLSCVDNLGMPLVFHMQRGGCVYAAETRGMLDRLMAKSLNTPRFRGVPRWFIEAAEAVYRPLRRKRNRMRRFFPGYLLDFASLEMRLREYPDIKFVGHGPLFWKGISSFMDMDSSEMPRGAVLGEGIACRLLAEYENMYADLSAHSGFNALTRDPAFAKRFLSRFSHKLLFGTDNFFLGLREFLESLKLSREEYSRIFGGNACRLAGDIAGAGAAIKGDIKTGREAA